MADMASEEHRDLSEKFAMRGRICGQPEENDRERLYYDNVAP